MALALPPRSIPAKAENRFAALDLCRLCFDSQDMKGRLEHRGMQFLTITSRIKDVTNLRFVWMM